MPTGAYSLKPCDVDPRRWERCRREAAAGLKARGIFDSHRRYHAMLVREANRRFNAS